MDDLTAWLHARLDEEERQTRAACHGAVGRWSGPSAGAMVEYEGHPDDWPDVAPMSGVVVYNEGAPTDEQAEHIARWDPARVLAEIDAKRRILAFHEGRHQCQPEPEDTEWHVYEAGERVALVYPCLHLRVLALPYADRDGYRDEWRPEP